RASRTVRARIGRYPSAGLLPERDLLLPFSHLESRGKQALAIKTHVSAQTFPELCAWPSVEDRVERPCLRDAVGFFVGDGQLSGCAPFPPAALVRRSALSAIARDQRSAGFADQPGEGDCFLRPHQTAVRHGIRSPVPIPDRMPDAGI